MVLLCQIIVLAFFPQHIQPLNIFITVIVTILNQNRPSFSMQSLILNLDRNPTSANAMIKISP